MTRWSDIALALAFLLAPAVEVRGDLIFPHRDRRWDIPPAEIQVPLEIKGEGHVEVTQLTIPRKVLNDLLAQGPVSGIGDGRRVLPIVMALVSLTLAAICLLGWRLQRQPRLAICSTLLVMLPICLAAVSCLPNRRDDYPIIDARGLGPLEASANSLSGQAVVFLDDNAKAVTLRVDGDLLEQMASGRVIRMGKPVSDP